MPVLIEQNPVKSTKSNFSTTEFLENLDALPVPESNPETNGTKQNSPPSIKAKTIIKDKNIKSGIKGRTTNEDKNTNGAFITQKGENFDHYKDAHNMEELEALVSGISQTSQDTILLRKKKKMREGSEALTKEKEIFKKRMDECEIRKREFQKRKQEMRDQVLKFEKFILENDAKRRKAEKRRKSERIEKEKKIKEYKDLTKTLREEEQEKQKTRRETIHSRKTKDREN